MKKQQGAALIVVMSLLAVSLTLGLMNIQTSQVDERLAGNYKAAAETQLGAEMAASEGVAFLFPTNSNSAADRWSSLSKGLSEFSVHRVEDLGWSSFESSGEDGGCSSPVVCYYLYIDDSGEQYVVAMGAIDDGGVAISELVLVEVDLGGGGGPRLFSDAAIGCEGVELRGSGRVDSYSSYPDFPDGVADGPQAYDPSNHNSKGSVRTLDGGDVKLQGNSPIFGNVFSVRDVIATGSAPIEGDILAKRDVRLGGNNTFDGDVRAARDVVVNSGKIAGNAFADANITFNNWGGEIQGNAQYGGDIFFTNRGSDHVGGQHVNEDPEVRDKIQKEKELRSNCNPLGIDEDVVDGFPLADNGPLNVGANQNPVLTEAGFAGNSGGGQGGNDGSLEIGSVDFLEGQPGQTAMRFSELDIGSNGSLTIGEPGNPQHIVMVVDGDVNVGGGGNGLIIAEGSTLTMVVGGSVHLQGSVDIRGAGVVTPWTDNKGEQQLVPTLGIYSTGALVRLRGNTDMYATVYAPFADVSVGGSGNLFGSVRGKTTEFFGSGGMHYDEALGRVAIGGNGEGGGNGAPSIESWR